MADVLLKTNLRTGTGPAGTLEVTENGTYDVYHYETAKVDLPETELEALDVTPTKETQTYTAEPYHAYTPVTVGPIPAEYIQPEGTKMITKSGIYDVTRAATADVNVIDSAGGSVLPMPWYKFVKPEAFPFEIPFDVYTDGIHFRTTYDAGNFKATGGITYYVTAKGKSANDGLTPETATGFSSAYSRAVNGDTIVILEGDYDRDDLGWGSTIVNKSINIIGDGSVRIFAGELHSTFTQTAGMSHTYQATRSAAKAVIDYTSIEGDYILYNQKTSIEEVEETPGSYYINGSAVYVHTLNEESPDGQVCITVQSENWLNANNAGGADVSVVFQNIELIGKPAGVLVNRSNTGSGLFVVYDNVRLYYCGNSQSDALSVYGGTVICGNCKIFGSFKDCYNYNGQNKSGTTTDAYCIEVGCIGANGGLGQTSENQNGSTSHAGTKTVRINCKYYNNLGANVADVQEGTMSLNLGCLAFYSAGTPAGANENFAAQQAGSTMWLYGCAAAGAVKDISCVTGATMYLDHVTYKEKAGGGTINEEKTIPFDIWTIYRIAELIANN